MFMITKINKIKKLGLVFDDYAWDSHLPIFKQFNLVYGWNGSGKTTLSRFFAAIHGAPPVPGIEYEFEDDESNTFNESDNFPKRIRVFNQDYILSNVKILESRANSISVLLGEQNKDLVDKIEADKKLLDGDPANPSAPGKALLHSRYIKERARKTVEKDGKFTEIAKTIGAAIGGSALRDYRKPQAEKDFSALQFEQKLWPDDLEKYSLSAKQDSLPKIELLALGDVAVEDGDPSKKVPAILQSIQKSATELMQKTVEAEIISRLAENPDVSEWVEQGFNLHKKHSSSVCEYCLQEIPADRIQQLARYFNEADKKLKDDVDVLIKNLQKVYSVIAALETPDRARFYSELQIKFDSKGIDFDAAQKLLLADITKMAEELKAKKSKTTEKITLKSKPDIADFLLRIKEVNELIATHSKISSDFEDVKKDAVQKLRNHYLSTISEEVKKLAADITQLDGDAKVLATEIDEIKKRIAQNMAHVSSKHKACEEINKKLATFLGHQELTFVPQMQREVSEGGEEKEVVAGYQIMRGEVPVVYLSEGEKTAIAFVYFVVHLGDQDFNVADGIVVIDDPISSLDSNSLYQAFSFLKNAVKDSAQVFIMTHSFDFLKLLLNWRKSVDRRGDKTGYFMLKNHFPDNVRSAYLGGMDKELREYESEYHYLFKLLKQLRDEQDDSIAKAYPVPNIARKVWDTFLMFSVPNGGTPYSKMEELKVAGRDAQKLDAIYKFTNDQSHITGSGFNPALVPETKKVVKELFEMMEEIAPNHFAVLDRATN